MFEHLFEGFEIEAIPFRGYFLLNLVEGCLRNLGLHASKPRLERLHSPDRFIYTMARVEPSKWRVWKVPFARVETEPLIDHQRAIMRFIFIAVKNCLPPVCVTRPFVKHEHPAKIGKIYDLAKLLVGKEIIAHDLCR